MLDFGWSYYTEPIPSLVRWVTKYGGGKCDFGTYGTNSVDYAVFEDVDGYFNLFALSFPKDKMDPECPKHRIVASGTEKEMFIEYERLTGHAPELLTCDLRNVASHGAYFAEGSTEFRPVECIR